MISSIQKLMVINTRINFAFEVFFVQRRLKIQVNQMLTLATLQFQFTKHFSLQKTLLQNTYTYQLPIKPRIYNKEVLLYICSSYMNIALIKPQSNSIPPQVLSAIKKYETQVEGSIKNQINELTSWFISKTLNYKDPNIPRLQLLSRAENLIKRNIPDRKYMNPLFLEESSIVALVNQSKFLTDIAFVLWKHLELKVMQKDIDYVDQILVAVKARVQQLLKYKQSQLQSFFGVAQVESFIQHKKNLPESVYKIEQFERDQIQLQAILVFNYVFKPLFEKKSLQSVYGYLYSIIMWFVVIRDDKPQKQKTLMDMAKKIDSFLWIKKVVSNISLINTFNIIFNLLSVKYLKQDPFSFETLTPLLIKLRNAPLEDLINNWYQVQKDKKMIPKQIQNIFRNALNSGCTVFCFEIIDRFSLYLHRLRNYDALFHLFDSFIRKQYLSFKLPNGTFVRAYLSILSMYAIGFINRDRLDGQTELDRLSENLNELVCKPKFRYDQCYIEIIKFFRIYQCRFQFLSAKCRNFVSSLEQIYKINFTISQLHQEVSMKIFKEYSADYEENDIYSLQRSTRYAGLENLGNTCYMNSFMQALFMTKKFKSLVIKAQDEGIVPTNHPKFEVLVKLFSELNTKTNERKLEVNPIYFKLLTPEPFCSSRDQHDSSQFGRFYLNNLTFQLADTSLGEKINKLFTHEIQSKIICKDCNQQREVKQKIFDFILNIDQNVGDVITVSDLMRKYFKGHQLDENNKINCSNCKGNRPAFVIPQPFQLAEYLIVTASIFKYENSGSCKINKPLNFEFSINFKNILPKIITTDCVYDLYAFILHIGTGMQRGHYQCFARNLEENPMLWYKFDDHYVTEQEINEIDDFHFGQNQTPYILFYTTNKRRVSIINK